MRGFLPFLFLFSAVLVFAEDPPPLVIDLDDAKAMAEDNSSELRAMQMQLAAQNLSLIHI